LQEQALEIIFINWARRTSVDSQEVFDFLRYRYLHTKRKFTILKAYGWHDYVIVAKSPLSIVLDRNWITGEGWACVESSILGWILTDRSSAVTGKKHYRGIKRGIENLFPAPQSFQPSNSDSSNLYVLSLVSLNRNFNENCRKTTEQKSDDSVEEELKKLGNELKNYVEWGVVVHCVGIWDIVVIVKIVKKDDPIENIEGYKQKFLYNENFVSRSSSTILLGLKKTEVKIIKDKFKEYDQATFREFDDLFKPTLEELLCRG